MLLTLAEFSEDPGFWVIGGVVAVIWIVAATIQSIVASSSRERSRREIAAYIAEGSISPEQGERLMKAGNPESEKT